MLTTTTWTAALKVVYPQSKLTAEFFKDNPLVGMMPKDYKFKGLRQDFGIMYGPVGGRSKTFANAVNNDTPTTQGTWSVTRRRDYAIASWDTESMLASEGNEYALAEAVKSQMDSASRELNRAIGIDAYRDGHAVRGTISALGNFGAGVNNQVTLTSIRDVTNFEVGQRFVASPDASAAAPTVRSSEVITAIIPQTGVLIFGVVNLTAAYGWVANDELCQDGDLLAGAGGNNRAVQGLDAWIPQTAPGSTDSFNGINRSAHVTRLAGNRLAYSAGRLDERVFELIENIHTFGGGAPKAIFANWLHVRKLVKLLENQVERSQTEVNTGDGYKVGFANVTFIGPRGPAKLYGDRNCPADRLYVLDLDTWKFATAGPAPRTLNFDGSTFLRRANADGYEVRNAYYGNMVCQYPGANGVLTGLPLT